MGRKKKYISEEEKKVARRNQQMEYYKSKKLENSIICAKEARDLMFETTFPENWIELSLKDINEFIKCSIDVGEYNLVWKPAISVKKGMGTSTFKSFLLDEEQIKIVEEILVEKGYTTEFSNYNKMLFLRISWNELFK